RVVFQQPTRAFRVEVDLVADMTTINPFDFFVEPAAERYPFPYDPALARELVPYLATLPAGPRLSEIVSGFNRSGQTINDYLVDLNRHVQQKVRYLIRMEPGVQAPETTLTL